MPGARTEDVVERLGEVLSGSVLVPGDHGYDEARRIHNGLIDRRPAVIARCVETADVAEAVNLGRSEGLEISVRGGGHNVAGKAVTDGGLMIDLAPMKGIHVDPARPAARAQAGVTVGELDPRVRGCRAPGGRVTWRAIRVELRVPSRPSQGRAGRVPLHDARTGGRNS